MLECALTLARDLAYIWPRCPHPILPVCNSSINKNKNLSNIECYNCYKKGHYVTIYAEPDTRKKGKNKQFKKLKKD